MFNYIDKPCKVQGFSMRSQKYLIHAYLSVCYIFYSNKMAVISKYVN